jgi:large subunit ribosomal protein L24
MRMKNRWIKKGDKVLVIAGNDLGKVGEVVMRQEDRIIVQGVNVRKRHMKSRDQNRRSEIIPIEKPIHISNVALCDGNGKRLKLKTKRGDGGSKELVYQEKGKEVSYRSLRKSK